jgi:hypothetical protein
MAAEKGHEGVVAGVHRSQTQDNARHQVGDTPAGEAEAKTGEGVGEAHRLN